MPEQGARLIESDAAYYSWGAWGQTGCFRVILPETAAEFERRLSGGWRVFGILRWLRVPYPLRFCFFVLQRVGNSLLSLAALYEFQFRKIPRIAPGIERHKTIRLRQGMGSNKEIRQQTLRSLTRGPSPPFCITCEAAAGLNPSGLFHRKDHRDARVGKKVIHEGFRGLRVG